MIAHLVFWFLVLAAAFSMAGCQSMENYSPAYRAVHEAEFWKAYRGGGVDAMAVANLRAHEAAEKAVGK